MIYSLNKKSQVWTLDLVAGLSLFIVVVIVYFIFASNITSNDVSDIAGVYEESAVVASSLISSGVPENWNHSSVEELGLTNGDFRLNESKLVSTKDLNYSAMKLLLKTRYDFMFFFEDKDNNVLEFNGTSGSFSYVGKNSITKDNVYDVEEPVGLISSRRFMIYNNKIITMVTFVWE